MTAKKEIEIKLNPVEIEEINVTIVGDSPLIEHAWSEKAKRMMLEKQTKAATKSKHEVKIPTNDFINSLYWLTKKPNDGVTDDEAIDNFDKAIAAGAAFGFPLSGIKQSIIVGAYRSGADIKQTELKGSFFISGLESHSTSDLAGIVGSEPVMREDMVKVGGISKTADIRYRGMFEQWEIPLKFRINKNSKYSASQIINCVTLGGFAAGIGEWRPERDGQFGMYHIKID